MYFETCMDVCELSLLLKLGFACKTFNLIDTGIVSCVYMYVCVDINHICCLTIVRG